MDWKLVLAVFSTVFIAEIGDKTQLATFLYAANSPQSKFTVFLGSATALLLTSALGAFLGSWLSGYLNPRYLSWLAGAVFIAVGIWTMLKS